MDKSNLNNLQTPDYYRELGKVLLNSTGGTFTGDPDINTTYYLEYPPVG